MCSGRSRNSISKLISASFGRYGFRLICSLMRQSFEKRLFVCDLWTPRSNAHWLFISFINYFFFLILKCEQVFLSFFWLFWKSKNFLCDDKWKSYRMSCSVCAWIWIFEPLNFRICQQIFFAVTGQKWKNQKPNVNKNPIPIFRNF